MSDSTEVELAPGESVTVEAHTLYDIYSFDIIDDPLFGEQEIIGSGDAYHAVGFCTVVK